jgi:hypothetical protein
MLGVTVHYPTLNAYEQAALQGIEPKAILLRCELREASGRVVAEGVGARSLAQDGGDLNKSLKMAEKSAMIDATLRMAGLSEVFTQDLEDLRGEVPPAVVPAATTPPVPQSVVRPDEPDNLAAQLRHFQLDPLRVLAWCQRRWGTGDFSALDAAQQQELLRRLPDFARQATAEPPAKAVPVAPAASTPAGAVPAPLQQQLERQARLKGMPVPAVATLEQAKAELQRLFQLPPAASAA